MPRKLFRFYDNVAACSKLYRRQFCVFGVFLILGFCSSGCQAFCSTDLCVDRKHTGTGSNLLKIYPWNTRALERKAPMRTIATIITRSKRGSLRNTQSEDDQTSASDRPTTLLEGIRRSRKSRSKRRRDKRRTKGINYRETVPHSGRHFFPSHPCYSRPLLQRLFRKLRNRKRFMEGWYYRLTLKDYEIDNNNNNNNDDDDNDNNQTKHKSVSFAFIISIEDPGIKSSDLRLACLQAIGPNDQYLIQSTKDDTKFWGSKESQSLGCTFEEYSHDSDNSNTEPRLDPVEWKKLVKSGFQITDDSSFRTASTADPLYKPRWMGRIAGHDGSRGGVIVGPGVDGTLDFDFEVDPDSVCGYGGYTTTINDATVTTDGVVNIMHNNDGAVLASTDPSNFTAEKGRRRSSHTAQRQKSTGGWLSSFPIFEPHWQVTMADALASGRVNWNGTEYKFKDQPFYAEKNWGNALPSKWYWTQCNSFDNVEGELSVTAGGGIRKLPFGKEEELGMIALHHKGRFYEAVPWKGNVEWNVSTWGEWNMYGDRLEETIDPDTGSITPPFAVEIRYRCDPEKLPGLVFRAPTPKKGMVPFCRDTFEANCVLTMWELKRNKDTTEYEKVEPPIIDHARSKEGGAEIGGGPWWETWHGKSQLKPLIKGLLNFPNRFLR